jgi:hypothetical protein
MSLHSSGSFSARLCCRAQNRPQNSFGYTCGDFGPAALPGEKTLAFGATIHFVISSCLNLVNDEMNFLQKSRNVEPVSFSIDTPLAFIVTIIAVSQARISQAAS